MRKILLLLFFGINGLSSFAQKPLDVKISITFDDNTLEEALFLLIDKTGIQFSFSNNILPDTKITYQAHQKRLAEVLDYLLKETTIKYEQRDRRIILFVGEPPPVKKWYTISGFISDSASLEPLIGASVVDLNSQKGTVTINSGFFSLTLPMGEVILSLSYVGYKTEVIPILLENNHQIHLHLSQYVNMMKEIIVVANDSLNEVPKSGASEQYISIADINQLPRLGGEPDLVRTAYLLPGIHTGTDGVDGMYVRGGEPGQNLILIDGVPVYYTAHAAGLFSIFNTNAISSAKLVKGGFPARYGGRTSSVFDIRTKDGNKRDFEGGVDLGLLTGRFTFEGPIVKDKSSFIFTGRKSLIDWYLKSYSRNVKAGVGDDGQTSYGFYDFNAKLNYSLSDKDKVYITYYQGVDDFLNEGISRDTLNLEGANQSILSYYFPQEYSERFNWGNKVGALKWNHVFNNQLFANITASYSNLDVKLGFQERDSVILLNTGAFQHRLLRGQFQSGIKELAAKADFDYFPSDKNYVRFGMSMSTRSMSNGVIFYEDTLSNPNLDLKLLNIETQEYDLYVENEFHINEDLLINAGLRLSNMHVKKKSYHSLQPRLSAYWQLNPKISFLASISKMSQFLHLLASSGLGLPTDIWVPATNKVKPQHTWQGVTGFKWNFSKGLDLRVEGYYKKMENLVSYSEGARFLNNWEDNVTVGKGWAYGMEVMLRKTQGQTSGWLAYTLAWTNRQFEFINQGRPYPFKYDRRHDLKLVLAHRLKPSLEFTANWTMSSGFRFNLPYGTIPLRVPGTSDSEIIEIPFPIIGEKNELKMPIYHRLDLGMNLTFQYKGLDHILNVGVFNAYYRKNPLYIRVKSKYTDENNTLKEVNDLVQVSLIPLTPSLNYSIRF